MNGLINRMGISTLLQDLLEWSGLREWDFLLE